VATKWFWTGSDGEKHGPVTSQELKDLAQSGQLTTADWVKRDGMDKSVKASRVKGLFVTTGPG
jgi:GYF domain 2